MSARAYVARAKPDGYTLLVSSAGPLSINQQLYASAGLRSRQGLRAHIDAGIGAHHAGLEHEARRSRPSPK